MAIDADVIDTGNSFSLLEDPMDAVRAYALWTHLEQFSCELAAGVHALLRWDQAGMT